MERNILAYSCKKCGTVHYPNRTLCKKCKHDVFEPVALPKNGTLLTFTRLHTLAADFDVADLQLGIVELENGNRITGQLRIKEPQIGMKVRGKVEAVRGNELRTFHGMIFYAA
jgi:hypothetical protein